MAAIAISTVVIALASIDIGYLFFQKRELQKAADLAALAGAQQLARSSAATDPCASALAIAKLNANQQVTLGFSTSELVATCGSWDPVKNTTAPHYVVHQAGQPTPNAVSVWVNRSFPSFFGSWANRNVSVQAIATADAEIAVFSVGSKLLQVQGNGVVPKLLTGLGVNVDGASLASYNGLANANIKPSGLLKALGVDVSAAADVATIRSAVLLNTGSNCGNGFCPLNALLGKITAVAGQQNLVDLLGIKGDQLTLPVKILSDATGRGLFVLADAANGQAALNSDINVLELVTAAVGVANSHRFIDANSGLDLPGLGSANIRVGIVEPPSIGIGGKGTTAFTSQVRVFNHIVAPSPVGSAASKLLKVDLPIAIDVVNGHGTITDMCRELDADGKQTATIQVSAPILNVCVGNMNEATAFSTTASCNVSGNAPFINILNNTLILGKPFELKVLPWEGSVTLSKGQTVTVGNNNLQLGTTVTNAWNAVLATLLGQVLNTSLTGTGVTKNSFAGGLLAANGNGLKDTLEALETSATSLQTFVNGLNSDVKTLLNDSLSSGVIGLLSNVGNLVGGLLNGVLNLLGNIVQILLNLLLCNATCQVEKPLTGNSSNPAVSNLLLAVLAILEKLLEPLLNTLGSQIQTVLNGLLGIQLGLVDVTLIDLNCGGGDTARLVY
ncbi:MAG: hypothetical protein K2Y13_14025 [Burkholderiaceae bacterium]|nr:hypothetical protein [Burkholderiaceae bacterium]